MWYNTEHFEFGFFFNGFHSSHMTRVCLCCLQGACARFVTSAERRRWCANTGSEACARRGTSASSSMNTTWPRCPSATSTPSLVRKLGASTPCERSLARLFSNKNERVWLCVCHYRRVQQQGMSLLAHRSRVQNQRLSLVRPRLLQTRWVLNDAWSFAHVSNIKLTASFASLPQVPTADTDTPDEWSASTIWSDSVRKENPASLCSMYRIFYSSFHLELSWAVYAMLFW